MSHDLFQFLEQRRALTLHNLTRYIGDIGYSDWLGHCGHQMNELELTKDAFADVLDIWVLMPLGQIEINSISYTIVHHQDDCFEPCPYFCGVSANWYRSISIGNENIFINPVNIHLIRELGLFEAMHINGRRNPFGSTPSYLRRHFWIE